MDERCDFCGLYLDDEEELTPVHIGDVAERSEASARGIAEVPDAESRFPADGEMRIGGEPAAYYDALRRALDDMQRSEDVEVKVGFGVPVQTVGGANPVAVASQAVDPAEGLTSPDVEEFDAVEVEVNIQPPDREPDFEVCEVCAEGKLGVDTDA